MSRTAGTFNAPSGSARKKRNRVLAAAQRLGKAATAARVAYESRTTEAEARQLLKQLGWRAAKLPAHQSRVWLPPPTPTASSEETLLLTYLLTKQQEREEERGEKEKKEAAGAAGAGA